MKLDKLVKLHDSIVEQNRILYSSSGLMAIAMNEAMINYEQKVNEMMNVISPNLQNMANRVAEINRIISPSLLEFSRQANEVAISISPAVHQISQQSKQLTDTLSLSLIEIMHNKEIMQIELNPFIQQMAESLPSWPDINLLATKLTDIIQSNPYLEQKEDIDVLSSQEKMEIESAIIEIISEPKNWQQSIVKALDAFRGKNPLLSIILMRILSVILAIFLGAASIVLADVAKNTWLKEEPTSSSPIITRLELNQTVFVTNEVPYYFEVEFTDEESGETFKGWVSKRSLRPGINRAK